MSSNGCLCERIIDGLVVKLWELSGEITITVKDDKTGENFAIEVKPQNAIDAFYHPFAYKARAERVDRSTGSVHNDSDSN
jgi:hypothetical protein